MTILPPYEAPYKPVPQVTPFTYRDGVTMLEKLKGMTRYINRTLVPFVNDNYSDLADAFETHANALIEAVNAAIDLVINSGVEIQDPVVADIFELADSATRQVVDLLYAPASLTGTVTGINTRVTNLETAVGVINTSITGINSSITLLNTNLRKFVARSVKDFGAIGDGVTDDTAALNAALAASVALYWGGPGDVYRVTAALTRTLTKDLVWRSDGATIKLESAGPVQRVVAIQTAGFNVSVDGPLTIDGNNKAFTCWYFCNQSTTGTNISLVGLVAKNAYRIDQSMTGGDGIHVLGLWTNVYIDRPDVRNIKMAAGAGVSGSQGVSGITVSSFDVGKAPGEITIISPYIENIYSEDVSYLQDQDGIRIFTEENTASVIAFTTHFNIRGGKIINCGGRAIKTQCEFGTVDGTFIRRSGGAPWGSRVGSMPEIDFQTSGGIIRNIEVQYVSNTPARVIGWGGTLLTGGKYTSGILVSGVKLVYSGSQTLSRFMSVTLNEQINGVITVEDVEIENYASTLQTYFMTIQGTYVGTQQFIVRLRNITAPMLATTPFLQRLGVAIPTNASLQDLANVAASGNAAFSALTNAGAYTQVTSGNNVKVV